MQWDATETPFLIIASLLIAQQVYWIGAVVRRNQRRRLGESLGVTAFQRELQQFFKSEWIVLSHEATSRSQE